MTPWDWQQMVRMAGTKKQFTVVNLETSDFKDFKNLFEGPAAPYINKKKNTGEQISLFPKCVTCRYEETLLAFFITRMILMKIFYK